MKSIKAPTTPTMMGFLVKNNANELALMLRGPNENIICVRRGHVEIGPGPYSNLKMFYKGSSSGHPWWLVVSEREIPIPFNLQQKIQAIQQHKFSRKGLEYGDFEPFLRRSYETYKIK